MRRAAGFWGRFARMRVRRRRQPVCASVLECGEEEEEEEESGEKLTFFAGEFMSWNVKFTTLFR